MKYLLALALLFPTTLFGATAGVSYNTVTRGVLQTDLDQTFDDIVADVGAFTTLTKGAVTVPNINNATWFSGGSATETWTFNLSAGDPVITFGNGVVNVTTGTLQQGGTAVALQSRTLTVAGTANEITSSAGAQDLSANRTWTLSLPTALTFTGKTITGGSYSSPTLTTPTISGAITFPDGVRQTFNPDGTTPGLNVGSQAGDPSGPSNGDLLYNSSLNALRARINGAWVSLGAGGGGGTPGGSDTQLQFNDAGSFGGANITITGASDTDLNAGNLIATNISYAGSFRGIGPAADSRMDVPDDDESHYAGFQANNTTTTSVNMIFPAAPFTGIPLFTASGTNFTMSAAAAGTDYTGIITLTAGAGMSGGGTTAANRTFTWDASTFANNVTLWDGANASRTFTINLSGTDPVWTYSSAVANLSAGALQVGGVAVSTASSTDVFSNKTFDAANTGNVLKQLKQLNLQRPDYGDGAGAVPQTNTFTASGLMHYTFSGNAETNANYTVYEFDVPSDLDTSVEITARFAFLSGGTDSDNYVFHLTYATQAAGAAYVTGTSIATSPIVMTVTPTTPASGDLQQSSATTLTGWAAGLTPGLPMQVRIARLQNTQDDSARDVQLVITYTSTL